MHDAEFGEDMFGLMARTGGGLPADVLPFAVNQVTQVGLDFLLAASAYGAERVVALLAPGKVDERPVLEAEFDLAGKILDGLGYGTGHYAIADDIDPEALEKRLYGFDGLTSPPGADFLPLGRKRSIMALALEELHTSASTPVDAIELPAGAPFGTVIVDTDGCTICLACVGACPTGALKDNPNKPQLNFREDACIQCGLCKATCPEKVITLVPRLSFAVQARDHRLVKEEEPFLCIRCSKPFGTKSSIETMVAKLAEHSMFSGEGRLECALEVATGGAATRSGAQCRGKAGAARPRSKPQKH